MITAKNDKKNSEHHKKVHGKKYRSSPEFTVHLTGAAGGPSLLSPSPSGPPPPLPRLSGQAGSPAQCPRALKSK